MVTLASLERQDIRAAFESINPDTVDRVIVLAPLLDAITVLDGLDIGVPVVTFQQGSQPSPTSVSVDEVHGARMVVRHLLDLGHETVWHVHGPPGWLATSSRVQGCAAELGLAGRFVPQPLATSGWSAAEGYRVGCELAQKKDVTAVFAANDLLALGVIKAMDEAGRNVPGDVSLVGFDDVKAAPFFRPALTTVKLDLGAIGHLTVSRILATIKDEAEDAIPPLEPKLVTRDTTAPPRTPR